LDKEDEIESPFEANTYNHGSHKRLQCQERDRKNRWYFRWFRYDDRSLFIPQTYLQTNQFEACK